MRGVVQRVRSAQVTINGDQARAIGAGLVLFLGVENKDTKEDLEYLCKKVLHMRVFEDEAGKMNRDIHMVQGELMLISQFTLLGDMRQGNRPDFYEAMPAQAAMDIYQQAIRWFEGKGLRIQTGCFGADMQVTLVNDGPVTILLDSRRRF